MTKKAPTWLSLLVVAAALAAAAGTGASPRPLDLIRDTVEAVLETLRAGSTDPDQKRERIRSIVRGRFSFRIISQRTLGKHWKTAGKAQRERFVELFSRLLEATYLSRVENYSDETVLYRGERIRGKRARVDTAILGKTGEIPVEYRMVVVGGDWQVYDVVIEGVSLVSNYRTTYDEIIRREGMEGLLARMEEKVAQIERGGPSGED
ncbi:MAG: ABC transporter substrate-binding protein [Deferrisomatales bacterium]